MIEFEAVLVNDKTIVREDRTLKCFTLKATEDSSVRTIIKQFKDDFDVSMFGASAVDDSFDHVSIPLRSYNISYNMTFADIKFVAKIDSLTVTVKQKKDGTFMTTYTFTFVKELEPMIDGSISAALKNKDVDEDGKKKLILYSTTLEKVE